MTSSTPASPRRRFLGRAGVAVAAAGVTTLASALFGAGPSPAQADPGDTYVALGSSQLVASEDLAAIQLPFNTEIVNTGLKGDFASCPDEGNPKSELLPGAPKSITGVWSRRWHDGQALSESIAQAKTVKQAKRWETMLVSDVKACGKPNTSFYYGRPQSSGVGSGHATWALTYQEGTTGPIGGVAVIRNGTNLGLVSVSGTWGSAQQMMESVAKVAVDRLA